MNKIDVGVIMGGFSSEVEISLQSGAVVCNAIDTKKFNVYPIHILKEGWFYISPDSNKIEINKANFSFSIGNETIIPKVVFNTVHGTPGEDGYLQAYFELLGIPQTSSGFYEAALTFNKRDCLTVLKNKNIQIANSYYLTQGDEIDLKEIINTVELPCFVKPNRAGSSFGVSKVDSENQLIPAIEKAYLEDSEILIESAIIGTEVSVGVFKQNNKIIAFTPTEIVSENSFFDYEAKYLGKSDEITPARISEEETLKVQEVAKTIYKYLNLKGITRTDFIIQNGTPYFIETNTNPGLSIESIVPKQAKYAGISLTELFDILLENALQENN